jgi:hypothetical protein
MFTKEEFLKKENKFLKYENKFLKNENGILKLENEALKNTIQYISPNIKRYINKVNETSAVLSYFNKVNETSYEVGYFNKVNETSNKSNMLDENNTTDNQYQFDIEFEERFWKSLEEPEAEPEADETCCNTSMCMNDELQERFWKTFEENETYYSESIYVTDDDETDIMSDISDDEIQGFFEKK